LADQGKNGISWTDATWNPVVGCSIVSPACTNCYAMAQAARIERMTGGNTHYAGTTKVVNGKPVWTGKLVLAPDHILTAPLRWRRPRRVFVNSMSDLFHEDMPDEWIDRVFAIMALSPQHTFQILTKRPERMRRHLSHDGRLRGIAMIAGKMVDERGFDGDVASDAVLDGPWPLPNVWLGVTAEDQARADERIPSLLETPAAVRFVSAEPLLGPVNLARIRIAPDHHTIIDALDGYALEAGGRTGLDWIIVGGESGPGARPTHPDWIRSIRDQCAAAGVAFHFKQRGDWSWLEPGDGEWPTDMPKFCRIGIDGRRSPDGWPMQRVGKHFAGRLLDGVIHDAFPEARHG
jgi:protein gp37